MRADLVECQKDTELEAVVFWEGSEEEKRKRKKQVEPDKKKERPKRKGTAAGKPAESSSKRRKREPDRPLVPTDEPIDAIDSQDPLPLQDLGSEVDSDAAEEDRESNVSQVLESGSDFFDDYDLSPPSTTSAVSIFGGDDFQEFLSEERSEEPNIPQVDQVESDHGAQAAVPAALPEGENAGKSKTPRAAPVLRSDERQGEFTFIVPDLGEVRYSFTNFYMRAYCLEHGRQCTRQRTCVPTKSANARGRPVGLLTSWLRQATDFADAKSHMKAQAQPHDVRKAAREHFLSLAGGREFSDMFEEKHKRGEPEEPLRIKW